MTGAVYDVISERFFARLGRENFDVCDGRELCRSAGTPAGAATREAVP
jgi:hypothetical protein